MIQQIKFLKKIRIPTVLGMACVFMRQAYFLSQEGRESVARSVPYECGQGGEFRLKQL